MFRVVFQSRWDCLPPRHTAQAGRRVRVLPNGRPMMYKTSQAKEQERTIRALLLEAMGDNPPPPATGPVAVFVRLVWPWRKSEKKAVVRAGREVPMTEAPDVDNCLKASIFDALQDVQLIGNDSQVALLFAVKARGPRAYWALRVLTFEDFADLPLCELLLDDGGGGDERAAPRSERTGRRPLDGNDFQKQPALQLRFRQGFGGGEA